jgi:hypothetical protein
MKELFAAFNTDFFRALSTLVIPGGIAVSTWSIQLLLIFEPLKRLVSQNHVEASLVMFLIIVFAGLVIEDIGARLEDAMDQRAVEATKGKHRQDWYAYLRTAFVCELIGRRYIRTLVTRLKFELGTAVGILIGNIGLIVLWIEGFVSYKFSLIVLMLSLLIAAYLALLEAPASHRLLATARSEMLDKIRVVSSAGAEP